MTALSASGRPSWTAARFAVAAIAMLVAGACLESSIVQVDDENLVELRMSIDSAQVGVGHTLQIQALTLDALGRLLVGLDVVWTTSDGGVLTVDEGLVTGVAPGTVEVVASVAGLADTTVVEVLQPPVLVLSAASSAFSTQAGAGDPAPDTIQITNGGVLQLAGLSVDSIVYDQATSGWLTAVLSAAVAPSDLELTVATSGITAAGSYTATVWVSGAQAESSPAGITVALELGAGAASTIEINDGQAQSGEVGLALPVSPSVVVKDAFDNPVPGLSVTFAVTGGGGSVTGSPASTDATGVARVGSWVLGQTAGPNTLDATLAAVGTVGFTATGTPGAAAEIQIVDGNGQGAVAGSPVSTSPRVVALDVFDNAVGGVDVVFSVQSGGGSITGGAQTTDASGFATAGTWTLGGSPGPNTVDAVATSIPSTVTFTATALPVGIDEIVLVAGDAQVDTVGATLVTSYSVRVEDTSDVGLPNVAVSWTVTGGGGSITATSTTDGSGIAVATRVLGTVVGTNTAIATIGGVPDTATFTATANAGTPAKLVAVAGTGQSATVNTNVSAAPGVMVTDGFDNPIAGHSVTFAITSAGGSIAPAGAQSTAGDGRASLTSWTLGTLAATQSDTVEATAAGGAVAPNPLRFVATATAGAPNTFTIVQGEDQGQITGSNVTDAPTVHVADQFANGVPNVTVNFSASGSGLVGSASPTTDANGQASTTWTVDVGGHSIGTDGTYANTLTASTAGFADLQFTGYARYSFPDHVVPILATCVGCHDGAFAFSLNHGSLVDQTADCDAGFVRVSSAGGVAAADVLSVLTTYLNDGVANPPGCGTHTGGSRTGITLETLQAWVRNGAPSN